MSDQLIPTEADRALYIRLREIRSRTLIEGIMAGSHDDGEWLQWIAQHAAAARAEERELLDALRENSWDLRCFDIPTGGGDADIGWRVIGHWMAEPRERVIAEIYSDDPRAAIAAAIRAGDGA